MKWARIYRCPDCAKKYRRIEEGPALYPPCPDCGAAQVLPPDRISAPAIVGTKARAVDTAYAIASEDYGFTNMNDSGKEGDTAFIPPPQEKPDPATITRPQMIWGGASPASAAMTMPGQPHLKAMGAGAAKLATAEGRNPMQMLHAAKPKLTAYPVNKGST